MPEALLSGRRVMRRFGRRIVLEPLDVDLARGEVVALGGPNGAGKSTLLAILAGYGLQDFFLYGGDPVNLSTGSMAHTEELFGFSAATVKERRSGLIPCGGPVTPFAGTRVLLIGDAAGHVSPLTGGGIRLAFRYGRRAGQLIADHLTRNGPPPGQVLQKELPGFAKKLALRTVMDIGPPNWLYNIIIGTPPMRWFANLVYFHRRYTGSAAPQSGAED